MPEEIAGAILVGLVVYWAIGILAAAFFLFGGFRRFDPLAAAAPWRVKLVITPGIVTLWPVLVLRAFGLRPREDRP